MRQGVGSTRVRRARRAVAPVGFVVILVAGLVGLVGPAGARPGAGGPSAVEITTNHASVSAVGFDGGGDIPEPVVKEGTDFSAFIESVADSDASTGRSGAGNASQNTTVDESEGVLKVESTGAVDATWADSDPGDGVNPSAQGTSEFSITFEVAEFSEFFTLNGEISATADPSSAECTNVRVTSPTGAVFEVAAPSVCGGPEGQSIGESGKLEPGTYTLSIEAGAAVSNPDATGGTAEASFDIDLGVGCSITGTSGADTLSGTAEDDFICGLGGDDTLDGSGGDDDIFGGGGSDLITGGEGDDFIFGEGGVDIVEGGTGNDGINGGPDDDQIFGDDSQGCGGALSDPGLDDDLITGDKGNDEIFGCQGLDTIEGGTGDDEIFGNTGHDNLSGKQGSDKIHGNEGPDTITGGTRKDVLLGDGANDTLFANDGVLDVVRGGPGGGDEAKIDEGVDTVTGVEVFL